jgi:hypothetical protein
MPLLLYDKQRHNVDEEEEWRTTKAWRETKQHKTGCKKWQEELKKNIIN